MAGTEPTYDEFDDSAIDPAWTQGTGNDMIEDAAEGGTINYASDGAAVRAELWQEYPAAGDYTTTMDIVVRVKVDTSMVKGGSEYNCEFNWTLWDDNIGCEISLWWIAEQYPGGGDNEGAPRHIIQRYYITDVEDVRDEIELQAPFTNDWCLLRYAHDNEELKMWYSPDPFTQWYDITNAGVTTHYGQVGGHGDYGWGFAVAHLQQASPLSGQYRGYVDWFREGSGFGATSSGTSATLDGEAVEIAEQVIERYGDYIVYIDSSNILKIKDSSITDFSTDVPIAVSASHL